MVVCLVPSVSRVKKESKTSNSKENSQNADLLKEPPYFCMELAVKNNKEAQELARQIDVPEAEYQNIGY